MKRVIAISNVSTSGATPSARNIDFIFSSDFVGTVAGGAFTGANDYELSLSAEHYGDVLAQILYTISAGSMRVVVET